MAKVTVEHEAHEGVRVVENTTTELVDPVECKECGDIVECESCRIFIGGGSKEHYCESCAAIL